MGMGMGMGYVCSGGEQKLEEVVEREVSHIDEDGDGCIGGLSCVL